jgi:ABC-type multidrug transport system fused ATPase/permease subunit
VALARAVYSEADIFLLDDPLSAVDTHVGELPLFSSVYAVGALLTVPRVALSGRHLFDLCICGELAGTTRVLVTHQLQYAESADSIVVMANGKIQAQGTYQELVQQ